MRIIVCIKQVSDTDQMKFDKETYSLIREGVPFIINPFDENALEAGLQIKEKHGGEVIVISMGPPQVAESLRHAIGMGADKAILLSDRRFALADTLATSYTLAMAIKKIGDFDLVLFGKQSVDSDTGQVGPSVAELLDVPQITYARKIEVADQKIIAERMLEGYSEIIESPMPAVVSVVREINKPRHPSLKGVLKAKKADIPVWTPDDINADPARIGKNGSATVVTGTFTPSLKGKNEILEGTPEEIAETLFSRLREQNLI
ncbi:TPA: electron transfer flavoprotein subunit beta/FixA family protein [bacterium]|nr:electron transfer flavoprotein subunit beta/FixA family protein [bacterium]